MNPIEELKNLGYLLMYATVGIIVIAWIFGEIKSNAQNRYYWIGRKDGWDMHRRMIDNKVKTDEVFDYDKN
tara:strand:- start:56 stop:268 length:213 start_codon:yes stop_codon:yes gene_type:complete